MKRTLTLVASVAFLILAGCATAPPPGSAWEYRVIQGTAPTVESQLNQAANDGWVVVSSSMATNPNGAPVTAVVIKRVKGSGPARKRPAFGPEQIFHEQLQESIPMRTYGYTIRDFRFSGDYEKALVVFVNTDPTKPKWEFTLQHDGLRRYRGSAMQPFYTPGTANTPVVSIVVTLPEE